MVQPDYLKKKRKRKIAAIVSGVSSGVLTIFGIVAFLGTYSGTFTVSLQTADDAKISLSEKSTMSNPTTYLRIGDVPRFDMYTASSFVHHDLVDTDQTDYLYGGIKDLEGNIRFLSFLKYTFFVENSGTIPIDFTMSIDITENVKPSNVNYDLTDILRVRVYENSDENEHVYYTYAKRSKTPHLVDGEYSYEELVSGPEGSPNYCGYAWEFPNETCCARRTVNNFKPGEIKRYTCVMWLEGLDPEAVGEQPKNCSLRFAANILGYGTASEK